MIDPYFTSPKITCRLLVRSLGERSSSSKGDEVQFRFEDESGRSRVAFDPRLEALTTVVDGQGGNGEFYKLQSGEELDLHIPQDWSIVFLLHPWSGIAHLEIQSKSITVNLFSPTYRTRNFMVRDVGDIEPRNLSSGRFIQNPTAVLSPHHPSGRDVIATCCPKWRGVTSSTMQLFGNVFMLPARIDRSPQDLTPHEIQYAAEAIADREPHCVVISGGDEAFAALASAIKLLRPVTKIYLLWHSNFLQLGESYDLRLLASWIHNYRRGFIDGIGVVKSGLDKFLLSIDVPSFFVENVNSSPIIEEISTIRQDPPRSPRARVGIWLSGSSSYRKRPHAMLAAMSLLEKKDVGLFCSGITQEGLDVANALGLEFEFVSTGEINHTRLMTHLSRMSVNLYVTLSECSPMLPLESWSLGVPFILGPSCKLVAEDRYLQEHIVVSDPADPAEIAGKTSFVMENREEVLGRLNLIFAEKLRATRDVLSSLDRLHVP